MELSVRARKALHLLNIGTIGELCMRTEAELMGVKNFGMTSLMEIKEKLAQQGLSLRKLEE
jgi:DNA-directed RNA polymerase subunit alpha